MFNTVCYGYWRSNFRRFRRFLIHENLYTQCLSYNICSAWFLDIRISTCYTLKELTLIVSVIWVHTLMSTWYRIAVDYKATYIVLKLHTFLWATHIHRLYVCYKFKHFNEAVQTLRLCSHMAQLKVISSHKQWLSASQIFYAKWLSII